MQLQSPLCSAMHLAANEASKWLSCYTQIKFCIIAPCLHDHCLNLQKLSTVETIGKRCLEVLHTPAPQARKQMRWTDSSCGFNHTTKQTSFSWRPEPVRSSHSPNTVSHTWHPQCDESYTSAACTHVQPMLSCRCLELSRAPGHWHANAGSRKERKAGSQGKIQPAERTLLCAPAHLSSYRYSCSRYCKRSTASSCPSGLSFWDRR